MVGYISSADENGNCKNITVTLWNVDDFVLADYESEKEVYTIKRYSGEIVRSFPKTARKMPDMSVFEKLAGLLRANEFTEKTALELRWRSYGDNVVEIISSEPMGGVWFGVDIVNESSDSLFINVTELFFGKPPKPLEVSLVCDMLNLVAYASGIKMTAPFVRVHNSLFCTGELQIVLKKLFNADLFCFEKMNSLKCVLESNGELKKISKIHFKPENVLKNLRASLTSNTLYEGNDIYFLVGTKRDCFLSLVKDLIMCIEKGYGLKRYGVLFTKHISDAMEKILSLGEILVIKEHIGRLSDIHYLDLYELTEAFAFNEKSLELKNTVRKSARRLRTVKDCTVPDYITVEREFKYI